MTHPMDMPDLHLAPADDEGEAALVRMKLALEEARDRLHRKALELGTRFVERRTEAGAGAFCGLNLIVRRRGNSVQVGWANFHYKNGNRTGITNVKKAKGSAIYDVPVLKKDQPEWVHEAAVETEMQARVIREALALIVSLDKNLISLNDRVGGKLFTALNPEGRDDQSGSDTHED